jgi:hypothetical protein
MRTLDFGRYALCSCVATAMLAGCGGSQPPIGAPGAMSQSHAIATHAARGGSWMLLEAKSENLLYIADPGSGGVIVYAYRPSRLRFVGMLADAPTPLGECVDKAQHLFVTNSAGGGSGSVTFEYAHGGSYPIKILGDPAGVPNSCSVDPTTGNLAVTGGYHIGSSPVTLAVYKKARGRPALYPDADFNYMSFCSYDNKGNLFVDGGNAGSNYFILAELPKGSGKLRTIAVSQTFESPGGVQWDGKHLAVGDSGKAIVYQFDIRGSTATEVGSTPLTGTRNVDQFFIDGPNIIDPSGYIEGRSGWVDLYNYPAGGSPTRNLPNFSSPYGVVVSLAQNSLQHGLWQRRRADEDLDF